MRILHQVRRIKQRTAQCGPTSLAALLQRKGLAVDVQELERSVGRTWTGGTYASYLGALAQSYGAKTELYVTDLAAFDPSWNTLTIRQLIAKLKARQRSHKDRSVRESIDGYLSYIDAGGVLVSGDITKALLTKLIRKKPFIVGVNATYLYACSRAHPVSGKANDLAGEAETHFFIIDGYDTVKDRFRIADSEATNPYSKTGRYWLTTERLLAAIHLADARQDCCVLVVK